MVDVGRAERVFRGLPVVQLLCCCPFSKLLTVCKHEIIPPAEKQVDWLPKMANALLTCRALIEC